MRNKTLSEEAKIPRLWASFHRLSEAEKDLVLDVSKLILSSPISKVEENNVSPINTS